MRVTGGQGVRGGEGDVQGCFPLARCVASKRQLVLCDNCNMNFTQEHTLPLGVPPPRRALLGQLSECADPTPLAGTVAP